PADPGSPGTEPSPQVSTAWLRQRRAARPYAVVVSSDSASSLLPSSVDRHRSALPPEACALCLYPSTGGPKRVYGHPSLMLMIALVMSLLRTMPSPAKSAAGHALSSALPLMMLIMMVISLLRTRPSLLQSPTQTHWPSTQA